MRQPFDEKAVRLFFLIHPPASLDAHKTLTFGFNRTCTVSAFCSGTARFKCSRLVACVIIWGLTCVIGM
jgi:hypothetical protein